MNHLRDLDFWLKAGPTLAAVIVPFVTYLWLGRKIEQYKTVLSKDLENHKSQLQYEYQLKFYEFQTRYSWLHQRRAEAIEKLFALAARVQNDLRVWMGWENFPHKETKEEFYVITQEHFQNLIDFHDEKRIYFDEEIQRGVVMFVKATRYILDSHESVEDTKERVPELSNWIQNNAINLLDQTIRPLMIGLEDNFKELLSAETPSHNLVHTSQPDGSLERKQ
jgi:hypothetical protein